MSSCNVKEQKALIRDLKKEETGILLVFIFVLVCFFMCLF